MARRRSALAIGLVVVAVLVAGAAWALAGRPPTAALATSTPPPGFQPSAGDGSDVPTGLTRFDGGSWHIDYPSAWSKYRGKLGRNSAPLAVLASEGIDTETLCETTDGALRCDPGFGRLRPGAVVIEVRQVGIGPFARDPIEVWEQPAFGVPTVLDGGRAIRFEDQLSDRHVIRWSVIDPGLAEGSFDFDIEMGEPVPATALAQAAAIMQSFTFAPPLEPLHPDNADGTVAKALAALAGVEPGYDCFPGAPGVVREATVTDLGGYGLTHELPVRCSTTIEATSIGFWRLQFVARWGATPGGPAGTMTITVWVGPTGVVSGGSNEHSGPPYCCR